MASKKILVDVRVNKSGKGASDATQEIAQLTEQIKKLTELQEKNAGSSSKVAESIEKLTKKLDDLSTSQNKATNSSNKRKNALTEEEKRVKALERAEIDLAFAKTEQGKQLDLTRAKRAEQRKENLGLADSTKEVKKEVQEETKALTVEEKAILRNNKAKENLAITQVEISKNTAEVKLETQKLNKEYVAQQKESDRLATTQKKVEAGATKEAIAAEKLRIQLLATKKEINEIAKAELRLAASTKDSVTMSKNQQDQMKTTAGLSGAMITELGRVASDAQYGLRGMGNNISQVMTLFALFQTNVAKSGRTMREGFQELGKTMLGPVGIVAGLQILLSMLASGHFDNFLDLLRGIGGAFKLLRKNIKAAADEYGALIATLEGNLSILNNTEKSLKEQELAYKQIIKNNPEMEEAIKRVGDEFVISSQKVKDFIDELKQLALSSAALKKIQEITSENLKGELEKMVLIFDAQEKRKESLKLFTNVFKVSEDDKKNIVELEKTILSEGEKINKIIKDISEDENKTRKQKDIEIEKAQKESNKRRLKGIEDLNKLVFEATQKSGIDPFSLSNQEATSATDYVSFLTLVGEAEAELLKLKIKNNKEDEKKIILLQKFLKNRDKEDSPKDPSLKRVAQLKVAELDLSRTQEKFRQESLKAEIRTEEEKIELKKQNSLADLEITLQSFEEKKRASLKEFIEKQELKKKEKNADIAGINASIDRAKLKTQQAIDLAREESKGVIAEIDRVAEAENRIRVRNKAERVRESIERAEEIEKQIALVQKVIERQEANVRTDEQGNVIGLERPSETGLTEDDLMGDVSELQNLIDKDRKILEHKNLDADYRAEIEQRITNNVREQSDIRMRIAEAEQRHKEQLQQNAVSLLRSAAALSKEGSKTQKALSITATLVSTYFSAQKAYESQFLPIATPDSPVRGAVAAAAAVASGLANVKAMRSESEGSARVSAPTVKPPDFNIIGSSNVNQLADAIGSTEKQPIKAYVVSTEVTTEQALNRNTRSSAEL